LVELNDVATLDFRPVANSAVLSGAAWTTAKVSVTGLSEAVFANSELAVYPNPTSGTVNVAFDLVKSSTVTVEIFSLTGEKVATLNNSELAAGAQVVSSNVNLTSGVYFVKVSSNDSSATVKLAVK
jgi:hypothetical protein